MSKEKINTNAPTPLFDNLQNFLEENTKEENNKNILSASYQQNKNFYEDYLKAKSFLFSYRGNVATFNAYRREIERLLHWAHIKIKKSLTQLQRTDFETYIEFCQCPPTSWIGIKKVPRFITKDGRRIPNVDWHPFVVTISKVQRLHGKEPTLDDYALSEKALREIFTITSSFYNFLIQESYVATNPVMQIRQKSKYLRKRQGKQKIRRLTELQWGYVIETAELMANENPEIYERTLFIMNALYGMYLRISELAASDRWLPKMGDFQRDHDGNWWFITVGKGNKERQITVSDDMLKALKRYRHFLDLSSLPAPGEMRPLLLKNRGQGPIESTRHIRQIVQDCFDQSIARLKKDGFHEEAEQLMSATVHWLRHTGISDDVKYRPREHVRDDAGHSSSAITDKYIDVELRKRHESAKRKKIKPEFMEEE